MKEETKWKRFWILGHRAHPDGYIVPDNFKQGSLFVEDAALLSAKRELDASEKLRNLDVQRLNERIEAAESLLKMKQTIIGTMDAKLIELGVNFNFDRALAESNPTTSEGGK